MYVACNVYNIFSIDLNDIKTLHDDEALCINYMQSFRDCTNFNNLNAHAIKQSACKWESQIKCRTIREIAYENHLIQHFIIMMTRTETKHFYI